MILSGSANQHLAHELAAALDEPVLPLTYRRFADGELIVEVDPSGTLPARVQLDSNGFALDGRAIVVGSTLDDRSHLELLQLQDLAREGGASSVVTVVPYLGYARQDVAHDPGQPVSARTMLRSLSASTDRILTVNPHEEAVLDYAAVAATSVSAVGSLGAGLAIETDDPLIVAPDAGAKSLATELRDIVGRGSADHLEKERIDDTTVEISVSDTDASGREVVLVDDEISTGGTMATAAGALLDQGAATVQAACVHPLLVGGATTRLYRAGIDRVVATDTIERQVSVVTAATAIADEL